MAFLHKVSANYSLMRKNFEQVGESLSLQTIRPIYYLIKMSLTDTIEQCEKKKSV